jgi:hypothetical protein
VQEETSAPHPRLTCIHLHSSLKKISDAGKQSNSHITCRKEQIVASRQKFTSIASFNRRSRRRFRDERKEIDRTKSQCAGHSAACVIGRAWCSRLGTPSFAFSMRPRLSTHSRRRDFQIVRRFFCSSRRATLRTAARDASRCRWATSKNQSTEFSTPAPRTRHPALRTPHSAPHAVPSVSGYFRLLIARRATGTIATL